MKTKTTPESPYITALRANIIEAIIDLRHEDTEVGAATLKQFVRTENFRHLAGAPNGTNAAYYYHEDFNRILASLPARYAKQILN